MNQPLQVLMRYFYWIKVWFGQITLFHLNLTEVPMALKSQSCCVTHFLLRFSSQSDILIFAFRISPDALKSETMRTPPTRSQIRKRFFYTGMQCFSFSIHNYFHLIFPHNIFCNSLQASLLLLFHKRFHSFPQTCIVQILNLIPAL